MSRFSARNDGPISQHKAQKTDRRTSKWVKLSGWSVPYENYLENDGISEWIKYGQGREKTGSNTFKVEWYPFSYDSEYLCQLIPDIEDDDDVDAEHDDVEGELPETHVELGHASLILNTTEIVDDNTPYISVQTLTGCDLEISKTPPQRPTSDEKFMTLPSSTIPPDNHGVSSTPPVTCTPDESSDESSVRLFKKRPQTTHSAHAVSLPSTQIQVLPTELSRCPPVKLSMTHSPRPAHETSPCIEDDKGESSMSSADEASSNIGLTSSSFIKALVEYKQYKNIGARYNSYHDETANKISQRVVFKPKVVSLQDPTETNKPNSAEKVLPGVHTEVVKDLQEKSTSRNELHVDKIVINPSPVSFTLPLMAASPGSRYSAYSPHKNYARTDPNSVASRTDSELSHNGADDKVSLKEGLDLLKLHDQVELQVNGFRPLKQKSPLQRVQDITNKRINSQMCYIFGQKAVKERWPYAAENLSYSQLSRSAPPRLGGRRDSTSRLCRRNHHITLSEMCGPAHIMKSTKPIVQSSLVSSTNTKNLKDNYSHWQKLNMR